MSVAYAHAPCGGCIFHWFLQCSVLQIHWGSPEKYTQELPPVRERCRSTIAGVAGARVVAVKFSSKVSP